MPHWTTQNETLPDRPPKGGARKVLIVGAGPGGLAAAMLLARAGAEVKVIERLPHVGGRTSAVEPDGFRFDLGPTFFLYPRVLERIFAAVGRDLRDEVADGPARPAVPPRLRRAAAS